MSKTTHYEMSFKDDVDLTHRLAVESEDGKWFMAYRVGGSEVKEECAGPVMAYSLLFMFVGDWVMKGRKELKEHLWTIRQLALWYAKNSGFNQAAIEELHLFLNPKLYDHNE